MTIDPVSSAVIVPAGIGLDPGGIGKGLAADLVVTELLEAGTAGALVCVGGDLAAAGTPPTPDGWLVSVEEPRDPTRSLLTFGLDAGGVATSSTLSRTWLQDGRQRHHALDPATQTCSDTDLAAVTVIARAGWEAEAHATAALLCGSRECPRLLRPPRAGGHRNDPARHDHHEPRSAACRRRRKELRMNPQTWWYLSRSFAIVAWLMLTASVLLGVVLSTDLFPKWRRPAWLLAMHRWLAALTFFFLAGHLGALLADKQVHFGALDLAVPFHSTWRPTAVACGVVAAWLLLAVAVTAIATRGSRRGGGATSTCWATGSSGVRASMRRSPARTPRACSTP